MFKAALLMSSVAMIQLVLNGNVDVMEDLIVMMEVMNNIVLVRSYLRIVIVMIVRPNFCHLFQLPITNLDSPHENSNHKDHNQFHQEMLI